MVLTDEEQIGEGNKVSEILISIENLELTMY